MTNATKANAIALVNAVLGLLVVLGVLDESLVGPVLAVANAAAALAVGLTYKASPKRIAD